jgi:hypothetical protein
MRGVHIERAQTSFGYQGDGDRSHIVRRESRSARWTSPWAMSDAKTRHVVYTYTWRYVKHTLGGTPKAGLPLAELEKIARTTCREKIASRISRTPQASRAGIIAHLDSSENGVASRVTRLIYLAYRRGLRGPDLADELGMSRSSVRQLLHRLNIIARELFPESCAEPHHSALPPEKRKPQQGKVHHHKKSYLPYIPPDERIIEAVEPTPQILELAKLYNEGQTCHELSKASGIPPSTLAWSFQRFALVDPNRKCQSRTVTQEPEMAELAYWRRHGATIKELAGIAGVSERAMGSRFKRMGVTVA